MPTNQTFYYRQIIDLVNKGQVDPAYFVYGEETYLIDSLIEKISSKFLGGGLQKEMNYYLRYAQDTSLDELLALTAGGGLFSAQKAIVYKDYQNLRNPNVQNLVKYLKSTDPNICLIIVARVTTVSQARYKSLRGHLKFINILPLREAELNSFIREEFSKYNKTITSESINTMLYLVGEKIHDLKTEIAQVANFYKDKENILPEDVEKIVGIYASQNVFELTRMIARKKMENSLFILHNLLEKGENPGTILFLLLRHIMILWKIRGFYQSGVRNENKIQDSLKLYPRQFSEYIKEIPNWTSRQLNEAIKLLNECDQSLKLNRMTSNVILDTLVLKLINLEL